LSRKQEAMRRRNLRRLAEVARRLMDRFPERTTLAELHAAVTAHSKMYSGEQVTVSGLAKATGQHRQSIARWVHRTPQVRLEENPDDARSKVLVAVDMEMMVAYVDELEAQD